jgi:hypothetical protein
MLPAKKSALRRFRDSLRCGRKNSPFGLKQFAPLALRFVKNRSRYRGRIPSGGAILSRHLLAGEQPPVATKAL